MEGPVQPVYEFPPFCLNTPKQLLLRDGERIPLTQKALAALAVLVERHGQIVTKEELMDRVWPGVAVEENNLSQCISAIRRALGERREEHRYVITVPGKGYCFVAEVCEILAGLPGTDGNGRGLITAEITSPSEEGMQNSAENSQKRPQGLKSSTLGALAAGLKPRPSDPSDTTHGWRRKRWVLAGVAAAVMVLGVVWLSRVLASRAKHEAGGPVPASVVVLPFLNLGGDSSKDYISDGLTEELTTALAEVPGLRVVARTSAFQFRGKGEDVREIGKQLGVGAVLEGSVSRSGGRFHITAQLVSTQNGYHLWSGAYDGQPGQIYAVQETIVEQTTRTLGVSVNEHAASTAHGQTANPEAHDLYLEGRYYWNKRDLPDMMRSIELFEAATQKDPNFALAYAGLAETYVVMGGNGQEPLAKTVPRARAALTRALELDPKLGEAYAAKALLDSEASGERRGLEADLRKAVELSPGYASAHHWLGMILSVQARFEEADAELRKAQVLDPLSPMITEGVAENFYHWRKYDEAIEQVERVRKMGSSVADAVMGWAYVEKGMQARAIEVFSDLVRAERTPPTLTNLAMACAAAGKNDEARLLLREASSSRQGYVSPYRVAIVYVNLGEKDTAFQWLDKAYRQRDPTLGELKVDPMLDPIRSDRRYAELLGKAGLS
jgi:TolB-like protein/DNA-binding winged helix-turn-helix (wHTH) protein/tetratricopeptide (TPR) repeat protein